MSGVPAADRLAAHALDTGLSGLSTAAREAVDDHLVDWLGLVLGGEAVAESSPSVVDAVDALTTGTDEAGATVLPTGERVAPDRAALLNGTFAHSLDFDDTHRASSLHPGAPVIAAALAVAETEDADPDELRAAIAVGYDVACAVGRAVTPEAHYARGFHITATCGTFGATAAAGRLRGLSRDELASAFGVNGSQAAGSLQFLENGAWNKRLHPGLAASRAVLASELAAQGFAGAAEPLAGDDGFLQGYSDDPDPSLLADLTAGRALEETALKPYPCCRYTHGAIDALREVAEEVDPDAVESVHVELPESGVRLTGDPIDAKRRPDNFVDCQFSMPFATALALTTGEATLSAFLDAQDRLDDPEMGRLMDATTVEASGRTRERFPEIWAAGVTVETADGTHEQFVEYARGEPENPLGREAVDRKFRDLAATAGSDSDAVERALAACRGDGALYESLRALSR
ncbi:MmgE/PrpD family protein [Halolamina salifodinae]|uniref:2-methylcitrate dehydratase PrpD n=1 Tax=Halolamina salifodinae TaxID=1202767 RepID=A0A8T4GUD7_9EURY|nr:MmgE/PrpD family protein [Halolamina salifodinae]MBP1986496.1 2-methylcitrate dehydratase PrpD [Halolamina salifodinae]